MAEGASLTPTTPPAPEDENIFLPRALGGVNLGPLEEKIKAMTAEMDALRERVERAEASVKSATERITSLDELTGRLSDLTVQLAERSPSLQPLPQKDSSLQRQ